MKRTISLLSILACVLALSGNALSQTTINANAEVLQSLVVAEEQEIDFGIVARDFSTNPFLDPSDGSTSGDFEDASNAAVGFVSVDGTAGQTVQVTVETSITLSSTNDQMTLTPSYNWTYDNISSGSPTNPEISNTQSDFSMTLDGSTDDDGVNTILIGGTMSESKSGDLEAEEYTGTGSITINYL